MTRLKRAGMSVVVGQGFMVAGTLVSFLTVPLYLGWLGDTRYGLMLTALACAGYLMFSDAGLSWSSMLLISHEVKDYDAWKKGFDDNAPARDAGGFELGFVGRDETRPNLVHAGFRVPSVEAAKAFLANPELKAAMAAAGVIGAPDIRIVLT